MVQPLRILVADHKPATATLIKQIVSPLRAAEVVSAITAEDVKLRLSNAERTYDLAFVEQNIGETDGAAMVRWIRSNQANPRPNLPVFLMSDSLNPTTT